MPEILGMLPENMGSYPRFLEIVPRSVNCPYCRLDLLSVHLLGSFVVQLIGSFCVHFFSPSFAKLSQAKPQLQLSWLALASLNFT